MVRPAHSVRAAVTAREAVASVASVLRRAALAACAVAAPVLVACGGSDGDATLSRPATADTSTSAPAEEPTTLPATSPSTTAPPVTTPRPDWLGTRVLPEGPDGFGAVLPTPPELADRRFATIDLLPPPETDEFTVSVGAVAGDVVTRSTWSDACPVPLGDLRYLTMPFWGFDQELHTGELLIHADAVEAVTAGFRQLFERRFPIEEMRITRADELDAPPTGDGNNTTAFVCRPSRGSTSWSQHAYGLAVDVNPFHNPYVKDDLVLPELASAYVDRNRVRPGMILPGDPVVRAFSGIGWTWGGTWSRPLDLMHFSANGR